jgi:hypothetical protein
MLRRFLCRHAGVQSPERGMREHLTTGEQHEPAFEAEQDHAEDSALQRRLRTLKWPDPPTGARERVLDTLRPHLRRLSDPQSDGDSSPNGD